MRRLYFDTESDYYKPGIWIGDVEQHRQHMQERQRKIRFDCAVVYDDSSNRYEEFDEGQADALVAMLATADELISHSGTRHDLLILEQVCGPEVIRPLWSIPHHDLLDIIGWESLDALARRHIPNRLPALERAMRCRISDADTRWPAIQRGQGKCHPHEHFIECKLAKARFDVERTYAVFLSHISPESP